MSLDPLKLCRIDKSSLRFDPLSPKRKEVSFDRKVTFVVG